MKLKISLLFFKQTIILLLVSFFLLSLTLFFHFGIIGVVVFIRALFMLRSQYNDYLNYSIEYINKSYKIHRGEFEKIFVSEKDIIDIKKVPNKFLGYYTLLITTKIGNEKSVFALPYITGDYYVKNN